MALRFATLSQAIYEQSQVVLTRLPNSKKGYEAKINDTVLFTAQTLEIVQAEYTKYLSNLSISALASESLKTTEEETTDIFQALPLVTEESLSDRRYLINEPRTIADMSPEAMTHEFYRIAGNEVFLNLKPCLISNVREIDNLSSKDAVVEFYNLKPNEMILCSRHYLINTPDYLRDWTPVDAIQAFHHEYEDEQILPITHTFDENLFCILHDLFLNDETIERLKVINHIRFIQQENRDKEYFNEFCRLFDDLWTEYGVPVNSPEDEFEHLAGSNDYLFHEYLIPGGDEDIPSVTQTSTQAIVIDPPGIILISLVYLSVAVDWLVEFTSQLYVFLVHLYFSTFELAFVKVFRASVPYLKRLTSSNDFLIGSRSK